MLVSTFCKNLFSFQDFSNLKRQSFLFSVQNVEVVVHERDLGTDIHDAKRREPRCSFSVLMCWFQCFDVWE